MTQIMVKLSQMLNISKGDPDTPTLTEAMTLIYKSKFMHAMTKEIKELEQHDT